MTNFLDFSMGLCFLVLAICIALLTLAALILAFRDERRKRRSSGTVATSIGKVGQPTSLSKFAKR